MKKMFCLFVLAFLTVFFLVDGVPFWALAEPEFQVHNVDTGEDFEMIQQAIDDLDTLDGHTILVDEGTYYERLTVNKSVSLVGEGKHETVVDGGGAGTVVNVTAKYVKITNFTIRNGGLGCGVYAFRSYGNNISYNIVENNHVGILLNVSNTNTLLGNNCSSNDFDGIFLRFSNDNTIVDNIALNNNYGYWVEASSNNFISGNKASNNSMAGFWVTASSDNEFLENVAVNGPFGFWIEASNNNIFLGNVVSCGHEYYGVTLINSDNNTLMGNNISNNFLGVRLNPASSDNIIFHNNFLGNNETMRGVLENHLDNGIEGNYWSDYNGTDMDKDGIGEIPYAINANNTDYHPLVGFFSYFKVYSEGETYHVLTVCNSTILGFHHDSIAKIIRFNISTPNGVAGFCRIIIPRLLINFEPYVVLVDGKEANATLLSVSNSTHAFLYFTCTPNTHSVTILSRPYYELSETYNRLLEDYDNLRSIHENLNATYHALLSNYTELRGHYDSLQIGYDILSDLYKSLNSTYTDLKSQSTRELSNLRANVRASMAAFIVAIVLGTAVLLPFGVKYYRISNEQKRIIQGYNPLEIANVLFKTDVERRRLKIGKFEEKYGVRIRPRETLEDVIARAREREKVKK